MPLTVRKRLAVVLVVATAAGCSSPTTATSPRPSVSTTLSPTALPSPTASTTRPPVPARPRIQYTLDVASRADGTAAVLGQTCFTDTSCITWVRWSTDQGRNFPRASQQTVVALPPPTNGEPEGSTLNRIRLGPESTAWVWAAGQPGEAAALPLFWTADGGRTWNNSGEAGYRDVQPWGSSAWVLGGVCRGVPYSGCSTTLNSAPAGTNPYETGKELQLPDDDRQAFTLRRVSATEAFLLTGTGRGETPEPFHLWHTRDGARSWQAVALPRHCVDALDIALAAKEEGLAWIDCQVEGPMTAPATLWRTTDAGDHWKRLPEPPLFRYTADLVLVTADHALITSGGRADVRETRDGGAVVAIGAALRGSRQRSSRAGSQRGAVQRAVAGRAGKARLELALAHSGPWQALDEDHPRALTALALWMGA